LVWKNYLRLVQEIMFDDNYRSENGPLQTSSVCHFTHTIYVLNNMNFERIGTEILV
jgi:hypothetical protein